MPGASPRVLLILILSAAVAVAGVVDAMVSDDHDYAVVFGLALVLQLVLILHVQTGRAPLSVRRDLAAWVAAQAVATGETPEAVLDQCLASVRAGLVDDRER